MNRKYVIKQAVSQSLEQSAETVNVHERRKPNHWDTQNPAWHAHDDKPRNKPFEALPTALQLGVSLDEARRIENTMSVFDMLEAALNK